MSLILGTESKLATVVASGVVVAFVIVVVAAAAIAVDGEDENDYWTDEDEPFLSVTNYSPKSQINDRRSSRSLLIDC